MQMQSATALALASRFSTNSFGSLRWDGKRHITEWLRAERLNAFIALPVLVLNIRKKCHHAVSKCSCCFTKEFPLRGVCGRSAQRSLALHLLQDAIAHNLANQAAKTTSCDGRMICDSIDHS